MGETAQLGILFRLCLSGDGTRVCGVRSVSLTPEAKDSFVAKVKRSWASLWSFYTFPSKPHCFYLKPTVSGCPTMDSFIILALLLKPVFWWGCVRSQSCEAEPSGKAKQTFPRGLPQEGLLVASHEASDWRHFAASPTSVMFSSFSNDTLDEIETVVNRLSNQLKIGEAGIVNTELNNLLVVRMNSKRHRGQKKRIYWS